MKKSSIIALLSGIAVTAVFYEATGIRIVGDHNPAAVAMAGSAPRVPSTTTSPSRTSPRPMAIAAPGTPQLAGSTPPASDPRPGETVADAKARAAFAEQQLEAVEGRAIAWPENVAPVFKQNAVEQQLKEYIVDRGLGQLKNIDCSEYPCVEVLQVNDQSAQGTQALRTALNDMVKQYYKGKVVLSVVANRVDNGTTSASYAGVSVGPNDADTRSRARYRAQLGLQEYAQ